MTKKDGKRILFVDHYYPKYLESFYKSHPDIFSKTYKIAFSELMAGMFGTSDFYSSGLKNNGFESWDVVANATSLQKLWIKENSGLNLYPWEKIIDKIVKAPAYISDRQAGFWEYKVLTKQIDKYKPDVLYTQNISYLNPFFLNEVKKKVKLLVGQIASPLPPNIFLKPYDLIISSLPNLVSEIRSRGIKSEYQKLAFEPRVLEKIGKQKRIYDVTFVGSFTPYHQEGIKILEEIARHIPVHVWGQGIEFLSPLSPFRKNYHGEAWGLDMYKIFAQSKITINRHISISGQYANNMRLYEATGMGAMLITDHKRNLNDLFEVGKEVVEYKNSKDIIDKISYYIKNEAKRETIAKAGQKRTLKEHNYLNRMKELIKIVKKYI